MIFIKHSFQSELKCLDFDFENVRGSDVRQAISSYFGCDEFALYRNGKKVLEDESIPHDSTIHVTFSLPGGKGGFGSMLRAIGAQIEKTTNREACRDLSGRRLRDINEEQRLKKWIAKKAEREAEKIRRRKDRLERLKSKPAHKFFDFEYEKEISQLPERVNDALSEGLQKAKDSTKRPAEEAPLSQPPKKTWFSEELSSSSDSDSEMSGPGNANSSLKQMTDPIDSEISEISLQDPSCSDVSEQCPSFSDLSQQGPSCSDVSQQGPSCSDVSQQGPSCSYVSQQGPSYSTVTQQGPTCSKYEPYYEVVDNSQYNFDSAHRSDVHKKESNLLENPNNQLKKENMLSEKNDTDRSRNFELHDFAGAFDQSKDSDKESDNSEPVSVKDQPRAEEKKEEISKGQTAELEKSEVADSAKLSAESTNENEDFSPIELLDFQNASDLEALGLERLKLELMHRGLKCGGTLSDRAKRLWQVRGLKPSEYPAIVLAKKKK